MCGIVGYKGNKNAKEVLISGLKSLEYRGYDSSGVAYTENNKLNIIKTEGKIKNLENKLDFTKMSNIGIGHTRWATHGIPNSTNAHPHHVGNTTLVHNGIIENYMELKEKLKKEYTFISQTDTEVAAALIDNLYKNNNNKLEALKEASKILKGSYAFLIMFDDEIDSIYCMRKDSPLVIAKKDNEFYLASDISALLKYTNEYILLDKNEIGVIKDNLIIYDKNNKIINKSVNKYDGTYEDVMKNGFEHFMLKEINDEPKVVQNIIDTYVKDYNIKTLENSFGDYKKYEYITIIGCGSAYHAGLVCKSLMEEYSNTKVNVELASEYRYKKIFKNNKELVIVISQSGETADSLEALRKAKENGFDTLGIINVPASSIARESNKVIYIKAGSEIAVATTKAYLAQVLILTLLSILLAYQKKVINDTTANEYLKELEKLPNEIKELINNKECKEIAKKICKEQDVFFIGRNIDYSLCMEASLKLKEISYIHSEAYAAGELKHGSISLIENNTKVIGIVTNKDLAPKTISNLKETKARGSNIILVTVNSIYNDLDKFYDDSIVINDLNKYYNPILIMIPLQLLAYYTALYKGEAIDQPRNLAKSVTVE